MANIPRNAPCPCGSGKKFKRCCEGTWGTSKEGTAKSAELARRDSASSEAPPRRKGRPRGGAGSNISNPSLQRLHETWHRISESANELLRSGRFQDPVPDVADALPLPNDENPRDGYLIASLLLLGPKTYGRGGDLFRALLDRALREDTVALGLLERCRRRSPEVWLVGVEENGLCGRPIVTPSKADMRRLDGVLHAAPSKGTVDFVVGWPLVFEGGRFLVGANQIFEEEVAAIRGTLRGSASSPDYWARNYDALWEGLFAPRRRALVDAAIKAAAAAKARREAERQGESRRKSVEPTGVLPHIVRYVADMGLDMLGGEQRLGLFCLVLAGAEEPEVKAEALAMLAPAMERFFKHYPHYRRSGAVGTVEDIAERAIDTLGYASDWSIPGAEEALRAARCGVLGLSETALRRADIDPFTPLPKLMAWVDGADEVPAEITDALRGFRRRCRWMAMLPRLVRVADGPAIAIMLHGLDELFPDLAARPVAEVVAHKPTVGRLRRGFAPDKDTDFVIADLPRRIGPLVLATGVGKNTLETLRTGLAEFLVRAEEARASAHAPAQPVSEAAAGELSDGLDALEKLFG